MLADVRTEIETWAQQIRSGEVRAISRAITAIENHEPEADELLKQLFYLTGKAAIIGITGAPGTGKSTLVDRLAASYRRAGKTVGIIAVDPTSPFTGGAILGDRIRMQSHASKLDPHKHVGTYVLDRLERADRTAELLARLRMVHRHLERHRCETDA